jgi:hypothetical protein
MRDDVLATDFLGFSWSCPGTDGDERRIDVKASSTPKKQQHQAKDLVKAVKVRTPSGPIRCPSELFGLSGWAHNANS